ncbi:hypothetical protein MLD38_009214 [Melastoma candidum]|uniref:Uncharacterized protein n=1 Tax=Melastoma candidum TaxID=119954 RepID=A0ACB9RWH9_9MYRT|nr:hypothetical protein MLD38_009214 [Melastoma candidum]
MAGANKVQFLEDNLPVTMYELNIRCWDQRGTVSTGTYKAYMGSCSESEALHMVLFEPYGFVPTSPPRSRSSLGPFAFRVFSLTDSRSLLFLKKGPL